MNRAIALYEFINAQVRAGNDLLVRDQEMERDSASPVPMTRSRALRIARRLPRARALISRSVWTTRSAGADHSYGTLKRSIIVQEAGRRNGAGGSIVTGTPCRGWWSRRRGG